MLSLPSRSASPAASVLHDSAGQTSEQAHESRLMAYQTQLHGYLDEMFQNAKERSLLKNNLSNYQQLDELAERHRQLRVLADELIGMISVMRGGKPSFGSEKNVSPCQPRPQGQWLNQPSSSSRSRSPSNASSLSMSSLAESLDNIASSSQANVFSSSSSRERKTSIASSSQERKTCIAPPSSKREAKNEWTSVPSRKRKEKNITSTRPHSQRKATPIARTSNQRKATIIAPLPDQQKATSIAPLPDQQRVKPIAPLPNQQRVKPIARPSHKRKEKRRSPSPAPATRNPSQVPQRLQEREDAIAAANDVQFQSVIVHPSPQFFPLLTHLSPSPSLCEEESPNEGELSDEPQRGQLSSSSRREEKKYHSGNTQQPLHLGPPPSTTSRPHSTVLSLHPNEQWKGDSDKRPISEFILLLEARMIAYGTAEEDKWRVLANSTQDVAFLDWLKLNIFNLNPKPSWLTCTDLLITEFGNTRASNQARTDFMSLRQPEGIGHGASTLRHAATLLSKCGAKQGDWTENWIIHFVVGTMLNARYREKLQICFDDCYTFSWRRLAHEVHKLDDLFLTEDSQRRRRGIIPGEASSSSYTRQERVNPRGRGTDRRRGKDERKEPPARPSSSSSRQSPRPADRSSSSSSSYYQSNRPTETARRDIVCYVCQRPGHLATECRNRNRQTAEQRVVQGHIRRLLVQQGAEVSLSQIRDLQAQRRNGNLPPLTAEDDTRFRRLTRKREYSRNNL